MPEHALETVPLCCRSRLCIIGYYVTDCQVAAVHWVVVVVRRQNFVFPASVSSSGLRRAGRESRRRKRQIWAELQPTTFRTSRTHCRAQRRASPRKPSNTISSSTHPAD